MKRNIIENFNILNPKRKNDDIGNFYPYYAGFSSSFANSLIESAELSQDALIVDPWNGSGTTIMAAANSGYKTIGIDLNPVMVIASKANMLSHNELSSLWPITLDICQKALRKKSYVDNSFSDPLCSWLTPQGAINFRKIEVSIQKLLVNRSSYKFLSEENSDINSLSNIASFYYVALFRTLRLVISSFSTSNPTWIKTTKSENDLLDPSTLDIIHLFKRMVEDMIKIRDKSFTKGESSNCESTIKVGSSISIPIEKNSIDLVLSSPPYCTRIDYAVATMPELAILGYTKEPFSDLRKNLIGTSKVPSKNPIVKKEWGKECNKFLENLFNHQSKASKSYYFKNHTQYFDSLYNSIGEISRILKPGGISILVVQDSFYKELHNDLAQISNEMSFNNGLILKRREDFVISRSMAGINARTKKYRQKIETTESVLCFVKE
ncbi:MAG: DNA methyltransferase [Fluviicola sp.]|nr:DNA methyltransferase [Fluviicola sp.]